MSRTAIILWVIFGVILVVGIIFLIAWLVSPKGGVSPGAVSGVTVTSNATATSYTVTWNATSGTPPITYTVKVVQTSNGNTVFNQSSQNLSLVVPGSALQDNTNYGVFVSASNADGA